MADIYDLSELLDCLSKLAVLQRDRTINRQDGKQLKELILSKALAKDVETDE